MSRRGYLDRAPRGSFGRVVRLGKLPINLSAQAFYNVAAPRDGADWSIRLQCQFLFPK